MATTAGLAVKTGWAILGPDQRVRLILVGQDAPTAAEQWTELGYAVLPVTL